MSVLWGTNVIGRYHPKQQDGRGVVYLVSIYKAMPPHPQRVAGGQVYPCIFIREQSLQMYWENRVPGRSAKEINAPVASASTL